MLRFLFNLVYYQVLIRITSNLVYGFIVSDYSICWCLQADIFYNILHFCVFITVFTYKNVACEKC